MNYFQRKFYIKVLPKVIFIEINYKSIDINFKELTMDDGKQNTNVEKEFSRQPLPNFLNVGSILQSFWVRCRTIFPDITDRKFMESELRVVFYCGIIFWIVYLFSKAF